MWGYDVSLYLKRLFCPMGRSVKSRALQARGPGASPGQGTIYLVRLMVRPLDSQSRNKGSIPLLGTTYVAKRLRLSRKARYAARKTCARNRYTQHVVYKYSCRPGLCDCKHRQVCGKDGFPLTYGSCPLSHLAAHDNKKTTKVSGIGQHQSN